MPDISDKRSDTYALSAQRHN